MEEEAGESSPTGQREPENSDQSVKINSADERDTDERNKPDAGKNADAGKKCADAGEECGCR